MRQWLAERQLEHYCPRCRPLAALLVVENLGRMADEDLSQAYRQVSGADRKSQATKETGGGQSCARVQV